MHSCLYLFLLNFEYVLRCLTIWRNSCRCLRTQQQVALPLPQLDVATLASLGSTYGLLTGITRRLRCSKLTQSCVTVMEQVILLLLFFGGPCSTLVQLQFHFPIDVRRLAALRTPFA